MGHGKELVSASSRAHRGQSETGATDAPNSDAGTVGVGVIRSYLATLPGTPGVYRMIKADGAVLYVGKAKNLRKRVASYTKLGRQPVRIRRMVADTAAMEFVTTETEAEALLLESNLIKRFAPRYNILLRDDKSFPFLLLTGDHPIPQVLKYRGARTRKGEYFGPFASVWAVNESVAVLQRAFLLRSCADTVFAARTRPCLLYQIKRCSAPCVGRIGAHEYGRLVDQARAFLRGESHRIQSELGRDMQRASDALEYELAAQYRDRIRAMTRIQARQDITLGPREEADVVAAHQDGGQTCVQVFFLRGGRNYGNRAYFPSHGGDESVERVLEAFVGQFYARTAPPRQVLLSHAVPNAPLLAEALSVRAGRRVTVSTPRRGDKLRLVTHAVVNAREALGRRMAESASQRRLLEGVAGTLHLDAPPRRIEVFDNSHVSGTHAVGAMIVAGPEGLMKSAYRKFTIRGAGGRDAATAGGDDYAMMREVLTRRFSRVVREDPDRLKDEWPDLVLLDGGAGQLGVALEVFQELGIDDVAVAAIAKGPDRNAGRERIFLPEREAFSLDVRDPVLYFVQRLRDEAHRFAIGAHRSKRGKSLARSLLDDVPGIGAKRKRALLHHFGAAGDVAQAGVADLEAVEGISRTMARKIYDWFHAEG